MKRKVIWLLIILISVFLYLGERYFTDPLVDAEEENQETVDSFFSSAESNFDDEKRAMYAARRKSKFKFIEICFFFFFHFFFSSFFLPYLIIIFLLSPSCKFRNFQYSPFFFLATQPPEIVKLSLPEKSKFSLNNW